MIGKFLILFFTTGESSIPFAMIPFAIKILNLSSFIIAEVLFSLPSSIKSQIFICFVMIFLVVS
ncbi:ABC-type dipeptide/oligopeptide/nickel transport system, permease component [Campylobacter hominis ATCC BAA-381]|uniref:ABC-type dipeptide/oligopeptide/nickel transport system, permease component n=1 Tax=Campylobacter hominis (strain ATCC BAA-381 / DSM 21671 / CCUG 45161 / LMG 19568 / NCTC 13146 / CH001A) TaxID=360107 RepID=A7I2X5_CAMHC|nr:ABC-type dipeptide/oligopeptide/nickel transport system, permease component [Campylobacter hominis ATCC BAA-381]